MDGACGTTVKKIISEEKTIRFIREELETNPSRDMASMARLLCGKLNLKSADGRMRHGCCVSALRSLASRGIVSFNKKRRHVRGERSPQARPVHVPPLPSGIPDSVEKMGAGLRIVLIGEEDAQLKKVWNDLMAAEHPPGEARICGSHLKYLASWSGGYIGAFCFSCSALKLEARDRWINWSGDEREAHQSRVLKSVCGVELHRNGSAEKLMRAIAIDIVTAWRTMLLTLLGRECPQMPANLVFDRHEMLVLNLLAEKKKGGKRK